MTLMADSSLLGPALRSVCVYCGSSETTRPAYHDLASRFGQALAARGLRMVYGGGAVGLMGRCAKAAHDAGGDVLGIMPRFLERREIVYDEASQTWYVTGNSMARGPGQEHPEIQARTYEIRLVTQDFRPVVTWINTYGGGPRLPGQPGTPPAGAPS